MIALLNQFTLPQVLIGGIVLVVLNTFLLRWAMSRLQADPRDDVETGAADREAEILGAEPARSTVASPRARRLQSPGATVAARSAEGPAEALGAVTAAGAKAPGGLAGGATRPGDSRDLKVYPEPDAALPIAASAASAAATGGAFAAAKWGLGKATPATAGADAGKLPGKEPLPAGKTADLPVTPPVVGGAKLPEPAAKPVILPAFASVVNAGAGAKPDVAAASGVAGKAPEPALANPVDKPPAVLPSVSSGAGGATPPPTGRPETVAGKPLPGADLIIAKPVPGEMAATKKTEIAKVPGVTAPVGTGLIALASESKAPLTGVVTPGAEKKAEAVTAQVTPGKTTPPMAPEKPALPAAATGVPEVPAKSFWRPRIFLPTKLPEVKPAGEAESKPASEPVLPAAAAASAPAKPPAAVPPATITPPAPAKPAGVTPPAAVTPPPAVTPPAGIMPPVTIAPLTAKVEAPVPAKPATPAVPAPSIPAAPAPVAKAAEPAVTPPRPPAATPIPPISAVPPVPASPTRETPPPGAITRVDVAPPVPVVPVRSVPTNLPQPAMSNAPATPVSASKASAQLTLGFEITSLQLTPFFKLGSVQLRPLSDVVSLHLVASQQADGPMAAGISFQIEKVELTEQSQVRSILLKPLGAAQPATVPQPKLQIDAIELNQAAEGSPIQITPSQQTSTAVQFLATFTIASMDFTPAFEIGSLRLEPTSNTVSLRLAPSQRTAGMELPPTFEMSNVQIGSEAQLTALTLTPSVVPAAAPTEK